MKLVFVALTFVNLSSLAHRLRQFSFEISGNNRCCAAAWRDDTGVSRYVCTMLPPDQLKKKLLTEDKCPKMEKAELSRHWNLTNHALSLNDGLEGDEEDEMEGLIQTHECPKVFYGAGHDCAASLPTPPILNVPGAQKVAACKNQLDNLAHAIQVDRLFGPLAVVGANNGHSSDSAAYKDQWGARGSQLLFDMPFFVRDSSIVNLKFENILTKELYVHERKRLKTLGMVKETELNVIYESSVQSICQLSLRSLWALQDLAPLRHSVGKLCFDSHESLPRSMISEAIVSHCFQNCLNSLFGLITLPDEIALRTDIRAPKSCMENFDVQDLIKKSAEVQACVSLPSDTRVVLVDWVLQKACWRWPQPSVLWQQEDAGPLQYPQGDSHEICTALKAGRKAKRKFGTPARRFGSTTCQEGTLCACPSPAMGTNLPVEQLRRHVSYSGDSSAVANMTLGATQQYVLMQVAHAIGPLGPLYLAAGPLLWKAGRQQWALIAGQILGLALGVALTHALHVPIMIAAPPAFAIQVAVKGVAHRCVHNVGCWPGTPAVEDKSGHCYLTPEASKGGSAVWFLPPPGLQLRRADVKSTALGHQHTKGANPIIYGLSSNITVKFECALAPCDYDDYYNQRIGYYGDRVLNCQPLQWIDMHAQQRKQYASAFASTCVSACTKMRSKFAQSLLNLAN